MEDFLLFDETQYQEEERMIRDSVQAWVRDEVLPKLPDAFEQATFPDAFIEGSAKLGLLGMSLPSEYGGSDASSMMYGLVCEALEWGDSGLRSFVSVQSSLCMYPIFAFGSEAQKKKYLAKMAAAELIGCFGLTEPDVGSDPSRLRTHAKKVDGGWCLNGAKMWITNAPIADLAIVWAKTDDGIRGFIVEKAFDGFMRNTIHHKMSLRASNTGELIFDDCFVPDENLLPKSTIGLAAPLKCLTQARFGIAFGAIGAAKACFEAALSYAKTRKQFDKPIAAFQLVQKDLVAMFTEINKAQCFNLHLARLKDQGKASHVMVSMAKMNACKEALHIARMARNLLGGNGISLEYPVIRHMLNLESVFTYEGTDNIHTLAIGKHITDLNAFA